LDLDKVYVSGWGFLMDKKCSTSDQGPAIFSVIVVILPSNVEPPVSVEK
jgi:hypothetical protein